jgi:hypothetical protein
MAPPHATKKSTLTAITQTTTRQGGQKSRKDVVEETDELDEYDDADSMLGVDDEVEAEESRSQGTSDNALEQLMAKMVDDVCFDENSSCLEIPY